MDEELNCPVCGAAIQSDSAFCRRCGNEIRKCPQCLSLLPKGVMFCPKCSAHLEHFSPSEDHKRPGVGDEEPYMIWEGWPFSFMARTVQTRGQWRITLALIIIGLALAFGLWTVLALNADPNEQCCIGAFAGIVAVIAVLGILLRYKIGRENAEAEQREKENES